MKTIYPCPSESFPILPCAVIVASNQNKGNRLVDASSVRIGDRVTGVVAVWASWAAVGRCSSSLPRPLPLTATHFPLPPAPKIPTHWRRPFLGVTHKLTALHRQPCIFFFVAQPKNSNLPHPLQPTYSSIQPSNISSFGLQVNAHSALSRLRHFQLRHTKPFNSHRRSSGDPHQLCDLHVTKAVTAAFDNQQFSAASL